MAPMAPIRVTENAVVRLLSVAPYGRGTRRSHAVGLPEILSSAYHREAGWSGVEAYLSRHTFELDVHARRYAGRERLRAQMHAVRRDVAPIHLLRVWYQPACQRYTTQ